mmetsp:Transcript_11771/g.17469  ORF Transcript_11771/g.17469 Transcript_11771/m.17469 type:complete len:582 (-) Transcript_11771:16-1761(-)
MNILDNRFDKPALIKQAIAFQNQQPFVTNAKANWETNEYIRQLQITNTMQNLNTITPLITNNFNQNTTPIIDPNLKTSKKNYPLEEENTVNHQTIMKPKIRKRRNITKNNKKYPKKNLTQSIQEIQKANLLTPMGCQINFDKQCLVTLPKDTCQYMSKHYRIKIKAFCRLHNISLENGYVIMRVKYPEIQIAGVNGDLKKWATIRNLEDKKPSETWKAKARGLQKENGCEIEILKGQKIYLPIAALEREKLSNVFSNKKKKKRKKRYSKKQESFQKLSMTRFAKKHNIDLSKGKVRVRIKDSKIQVLCKRTNTWITRETNVGGGGREEPAMVEEMIPLKQLTNQLTNQTPLTNQLTNQTPLANPLTNQTPLANQHLDLHHQSNNPKNLQFDNMVTPVNTIKIEETPSIHSTSLQTPLQVLQPQVESLQLQTDPLQNSTLQSIQPDPLQNSLNSLQTTTFQNPISTAPTFSNTLQPNDDLLQQQTTTTTNQPITIPTQPIPTNQTNLQQNFIPQFTDNGVQLNMTTQQDILPMNSYFPEEQLKRTRNTQEEDPNPRPIQKKKKMKVEETHDNGRAPASFFFT